MNDAGGVDESLMSSQQRRQPVFRWRSLPIAAATFAAAWIGNGAVGAIAVGALGLGLGLIATFWARRHGVESIQVRTRYVVAGTLGVIILVTALTEAFR